MESRLGGDGEQSSRADTNQSGWAGSTHWTVIRAAAREGLPGAEKAMEALCRQYWAPVYAYIRRHSHNPNDAEDLAQTFIASFLESKVRQVDEAKGRFRSFLLVCLRNFLANERARSTTQKRGGGRQILSLEQLAAEEGFCAAAPDLTPDALYDKRWAMAVLEQALTFLEKEETSKMRAVEFNRLRNFLTADGADESYRKVAAELGSTVESTRMTVSRLRRRFGKVLQKQIEATVEPERVEEELRCLKAALRKG